MVWYCNVPVTGPLQFRSMNSCGRRHVCQFAYFNPTTHHDGRPISTIRSIEFDQILITGYSQSFQYYTPKSHEPTTLPTSTLYTVRCHYTSLAYCDAQYSTHPRTEPTPYTLTSASSSMRQLWTPVGRATDRLIRNRIAYRNTRTCQHRAHTHTHTHAPTSTHQYYWGHHFKRVCSVRTNK